jgi:hypothetical protein
MSEPKGRIVDAFAEWDDPHAFRVFLIREKDGEQDDGAPMEAVHGVDPLDDPIEARLYKAAFCAHPKDFRGEYDRVLGFKTRTPAERAAKAVKKELKRIEKGEPGPDNLSMQLACMIAGGRRR